jgi:AmmeMemoRadiSam system protein B
MYFTSFQAHDSIQAVGQRKAEQEHSIEMELPILKFLFVDRPHSIVPMIVELIDNAASRSVAAGLGPVLSDSKTLLVMSSDFCHWGGAFEYRRCSTWISHLDTGEELLSTGDALWSTHRTDKYLFEQYLVDDHDQVCAP